FIGIVLLVSPFINAYSLKQKLNNGEYTLFKSQRPQLEPVDLSPTDSIHIIGGNNLSVEIIQSDSASVEKSENSNVYLYKENNVLTIQYSKQQGGNSEHSGSVTVKTPSIKAVSFLGKLIVDSTGNKYRSTVTRYYSPFDVVIKGFESDQLNINVINGGGEITVKESRLASFSLNLGESSTFSIDDKSHIGSMKAQARKNAAITFKQTHVNSLKTNIDSTVAVTVIGSNIGSITPYN